MKLSKVKKKNLKSINLLIYLYRKEDMFKEQEKTIQKKDWAI